MENELITFRTFDDLALAQDIAATLKQNDIPYELKTFAPKIDIATMTSAAKRYAIMAFAEDFETINNTLEQAELTNIKSVDKDYYLFDFTDSELLEVLGKADEWSAFDVVLARKILADRGKGMNAERISSIREERIKKLKQPEPSPTLWIFLGYVFALMGGIIGVFIGRHLHAHKKTLPNGEMVFAYSERDRKHGRNMFYIATVLFVLGLFFGIMGGF